MPGQVVKDHGDGVGEIERGIGLLAVQRQNPLAESEFIVGEAAVFPPKNQGVRGISRQHPVDGGVWVLQRYASMVQPAAGGDHTPAIPDGGLQIRVNGGLSQKRGRMDGHPESVITENLAAGIDQPQ